jgi:hypothetical protein
MAYTLSTTQKAPLIDGEGNPLATADVTNVGGGHAPFALGSPASIVDDGSGHLVCVGNSPGAITFELVRGGEVVAHEVIVTVTGVPFDWTLGVPVPK